MQLEINKLSDANEFVPFSVTIGFESSVEVESLLARLFLSSEKVNMETLATENRYVSSDGVLNQLFKELHNYYRTSQNVSCKKITDMDKISEDEENFNKTLTC